MARSGRSWLSSLTEHATVFAAACAATLAFALRAPVLVDTDSYFHLAVARILRFSGWPREFPWARFSLLGPPGGFPDKEPLFHLLLAPFAGAGPSTVGGRTALALLVAAIAVAIAVPARRLLGRTGLLVPFLLVPLALDVPDRLVRLRPELLSLLLLLIAAELVARGRDRAVGVCALLYTLSYTAFHFFLALVGLWFVADRIGRGRWRWKLPLYSGLGVGLGLLAHPAFPRNLEFWAVVNVRLFDYVESLGAGGKELQPALTSLVLSKNLGWWLVAIVVLAARGERRNEIEKAEGESPGVWGSPFSLAALVTGAMYLLMWRFGAYFFAFASLGLAEAVARRPLRRALPGLFGLPTLAVLGGCVLLALPQAYGMGRSILDPSAPSPSREVEWERFGRAVPAGARIAAPWAQAQAYFWFAPQAHFLNFLDPVLMAVPFPREFALQRELFEGREPDLALAAGAGLDSDFLAFLRFAVPPTFLARVEGDPRLEQTYAGYNLLYRVRERVNEAFLRNFRVGPAPSIEVPFAAEASALVAYPRAPGRAGTLEGFVDAARVGLAQRCARFVAEIPAGPAGGWTLELAPYGPAALWVEGRSLVELKGSSGAILGRGAVIRIDDESDRGSERGSGSRRLEVVSCPDPETGRNGFFLRRL